MTVNNTKTSVRLRKIRLFYNIVWNLNAMMFRERYVCKKWPVGIIGNTVSCYINLFMDIKAILIIQNVIIIRMNTKCVFFQIIFFTPFRAYPLGFIYIFVVFNKCTCLSEYFVCYYCRTIFHTKWYCVFYCFLCPFLASSLALNLHCKNCA